MPFPPAFRRCAIYYDFDGTLIGGTIEAAALTHHLGINDHGEFSALKAKKRQETGKTDFHAYLLALAEVCATRGVVPDEAFFRRVVVSLPFFEGLHDWFGRLNAYAEGYGILLSHYVVSCGVRAAIRCTHVAPHMRGIYACSYRYGESVALHRVVTPEDKIRFVRHSAFQAGIAGSDVMFVGDGGTDIPAMEYVLGQGGEVIHVHSGDVPNVVLPGASLALTDYSLGKGAEEAAFAFLRRRGISQ